MIKLILITLNLAPTSIPTGFLFYFTDGISSTLYSIIIPFEVR